jgi:putative ABC transport system substrate-binding protein
MTKKFPLFILVALVFLVSPVFAGELLVVQSLQIKPYDEALQGFKSVCKARTSKLVSSEMSEAVVARRVKKENPDLILAIGMDALAKVKTISDVPIVYLMVLNPQKLVQENSNITGVSIIIEPDKQLATLRQALPHASKIGLLYDPDKSGTFVRKAHNAAAALNFELLAKKVQSPIDSAAALDGMKGQIDAFWMLPDTTVVTPQTADLLLLSAMENRIPVFTFSDKYVDKGALLSLEVDALEVGRQAGEMANMILAGARAQSIRKVDAHSGILTVNLRVAKKLGISLNGDLAKKAKVIK